MNKVLIVFRQGPYSNAAGQEGLDAVLAASSMNLDTEVLFIDDGVFLLNQGQNLSHSELRDYTKGFKALEDFGVEKAYVESHAMVARGLAPESLTIRVQPLDVQQVANLIRRHQQVFAF